MPGPNGPTHPPAFADERSALDRFYGRKPWYRTISQWLGLQAKLIVVFIAIVILTLGSFLLMSIRETRERTMSDFNAQARQVSLSLAALGADALEFGKTDQLDAVANELVRSSSNVIEVGFFDDQGHAVAAKTRDGIALENVDLSDTTSLGQVIRVQDGTIDHLCVVSPVFSPDSQKIVGFVRVGISLEQFSQQVVSATASAAKLGVALVLMSIPMAWLLVRRIFLPIRILVQATRQIASGELNTQVETDRPDVIGELARAVNEMTLTVKQQQEALRRANQQLADANRDLESKVEQRTVQFEAANKRLSVEIAEKEDFLRAVSHDLNAPLRNISGMVTMLLMKKKDSLDEDSIHRLDRIKKNVEVETDLINELLELSRIKTRRHAMEIVNLEELIWDLRGMFENDLKTREISIVIDSVLPNLQCEKARVRQVLQNLIDNAIKYMGDGETREIHIGCQIRLSEAEFYVRDTGLGMDAEDASKVFFVFRRGKNTSAQNVTGKGVGLASVKSIVETYAGKIWVESELGKGSTFRFTINGQYVVSSNDYKTTRADKKPRSMAA